MGFAAAETVIKRYADKGLTIATAESCTGGMIAAALTDVSGSSAVVDRGFVTYSNHAKAELLGVDPAIIDAHGAVSEETARAMVAGAIERAPVDCAVAVTGIAGPTGGSEDKPVGLVHMAALRRGEDIVHERHVFPGGREAVREATVARALDMLLALTGPD